jgi:hypothetical protein
MKKHLLLLFVAGMLGLTLSAQDDEGGQSRESMAVDATATQWSFQLGYQWMPQYYSDMVNGEPRPKGLDNYAQLRIVAPIPTKALTILPRLTVRHYEDVEKGKSGFGNTELFALIVPMFSDWGTGRAGIGPLVTLPGDPNVAKKEWGYGLAGAVVHNVGNWFLGILLTQSFRSVDPNTLAPGESDANPLGIAPFINYRFGKSGFYVQTADLVLLYDWDSGQVYIPIGGRFGKVWVWEKTSLNVYGEYRTSMVYKAWPGSAVKNSYRLNASFTIPVGSK